MTCKTVPQNHTKKGLFFISAKIQADSILHLDYISFS